MPDAIEPIGHAVACRGLPIVPIVGLILITLSVQAGSIVLDFGATDQTVYAGSFDGSSNFVAASSALLATNSPTFDLGNGAKLAFENVGAFNRDDANPATALAVLTQDFFYAAGVGLEADKPVKFTISGVAATDTVTVEFLGSNERGADVTFGGKTTTVPLMENEKSFTVVGKVTGATTYAGSFIGSGGSGEGDLSAARLTITKAARPK